VRGYGTIDTLEYPVLHSAEYGRLTQRSTGVFGSAQINQCGLMGQGDRGSLAVTGAVSVVASLRACVT